MKKYIVLGIVILFFGASIIPIISGNVEIEKTNTIKSLRNGFWKHEDVTHYNLTHSFNFFTPERVLFGTAYNYNNFSIIPSGDSGFDPWLVWINDITGDSGAFEFEDVATSNHGSCFLQIDTDGYIWVSRGGYADVVPFDLYKSNEPLSTSDYTGYTKKLDNFWTVIGACSPNVIILDDKVNLFFRNWWNDDPGTKYQHLQYDKNDFSAPLKNQQVVLGGFYQGSPIIPCYGWSHVDPRYNMGFLSFSWKLTTGPGTQGIWGSSPFIGVKNGGDTLVKGDDTAYSIPLSYQSNIDIPIDHFRQGTRANTNGVNAGITPNGYYYFITQTITEIPYHEVTMFVYQNGVWIEVWEEVITSCTGFACGVTKDYVVLIYGIDNDLYVVTSQDDCTSWSTPVKIVEETHKISGCAFAQPVFNYTDNTIRFFYGIMSGSSWSASESKHRFIKFDAEDLVIQSAIEIKDVTGGLFNINPVIKNIGAGELRDITWNITVDYGLILTGRYTEGTIDLLAPGEEVTVSSKFILGLGSCLVTVSAEMPGVTSDSKESDAKVFFIFIKI